VAQSKFDITVSIIVPCFNSPGGLSRLLQELYKQTYPHELISLFIVDDGSEPTVEPIFNSAKSIYSDFAQYCFIRHKNNKGRVCARNSGILSSLGDILIFCDVEDYPAPDYVRETILLHSRYRNAAVRANIRILPECLSKSAYVRYKDSQYIGARSSLKKKRKIDLDNLPPSFFSTCGVSVVRSNVLSVGLFDDAFTGYGGEDEEMGFRLYKNGVRLIFGERATMWDADSSSTFEKVCLKYKSYGENSGRILFNKWPDYGDFSLFSLLEPINFETDKIKKVIIKIFIRCALSPLFAKIVRIFLYRIDNLQFDPPALLYKYVLAFSYLEGVKLRK
jgi:glycosyltransferase involved in cell wall biosynthesis